MYGRTYSEVEKATLELMEILKSKKENMDKISLGFDIEWRPTFRKGMHLKLVPNFPVKILCLTITIAIRNCTFIFLFL